MSTSILVFVILVSAGLLDAFRTINNVDKCIKFSSSPLVRSSTAKRVGKPVDVTFEPAGKIIGAEQGELIEAVAKRAGVVIHFKCKQGRCMSCEVRLNGRG